MSELDGSCLVIRMPSCSQCRLGSFVIKLRTRDSLSLRKLTVLEVGRAV